MTGARVASAALLLATWWLVVPLADTRVVPTVGEVAVFMWGELRMDSLAPTTLYASFAITLGRLVVALSLSMAAGVVVGLAMGLSTRLHTALEPFVVVALSVPSLVYALITAMWFGFGSTGPIATAFMASVAFIVMSTAEGVRNVPADLLQMARAFRVRRATTVREIVLPAVLPYLFAAVRFGVASGWRGLVVSEIFAASSGAGWMVMYWYDARRVQGVVGYALFFLGFALLLDAAFDVAGARVFRWRPALVPRAR